MIYSFILSLILHFFQTPDYQGTDYTFTFTHIDNKVDILVNDSLVFTSGIIDHNPDLENKFSCQIGPFLTPGKDEVTVRLYNAYEPYNVDQNDKHWEIEFVLHKGQKEIDFMWDSKDDFAQGIVFEEKYYL